MQRELLVSTGSLRGTGGHWLTNWVSLSLCPDTQVSVEAISALEAALVFDRFDTRECSTPFDDSLYIRLCFLRGRRSPPEERAAHCRIRDRCRTHRARRKDRALSANHLQSG